VLLLVVEQVPLLLQAGLQHCQAQLVAAAAAAVQRPWLASRCAALLLLYQQQNLTWS
jgi:hypothetical protein